MNDLVIFGATGDLTYRKLLPALYSMYIKNRCSEGFQIICLSHHKYNTEDYIKTIYQRFKKLNVLYDEKKLQDFCQLITFFELDFNNNDNYVKLKKLLAKNNCHKISYYLAVSPNYFTTITNHLQQNDLHNDDRNIVFEKPFGTDYQTALNLNDELTKVFAEKNIYRIDHYLGKEMVRNILAFRFSNYIIEPLWNNKYIDSVQIISTETVGVETRAGYYDKSGALRDMVQNHMMQLFSLCAMDCPTSLNSDDIIAQKIKVLSQIKQIKATDIVLGQYDGYTDEAGVAKDSKTETFVALKLEVDNNKFRGVPFYLKTGKKLQSKRIQIDIIFKNTLNSLYENEEVNSLSILVYPHEGVEFKFNINNPLIENTLQQIDLNYYKTSEDMANTPESYERLLEAFLHNDHSLFTKFDELEYTWKLIDKIKEFSIDIEKYEQATTYGPEGSEILLNKSNRRWFND